MFIKKVPQRSGNISVSIARGYRDSTGRSKTATIKTLGLLHILEKKHPDIDSYFKQELEEAEKNFKQEPTKIRITVDLDEQLDMDITNRKNFGYSVLSKIYHELELDTFFANKQRNLDVEYNINNIMKLLTFARALYPASKRKTFINKDIFFENTDFELFDMYRALSHVIKMKDDVELHLHEMMKLKYNRKVKETRYDVTNYYFEIDKEDEDLLDENGKIIKKGLRKKGPSKENRRDPIVQMGLLLDDDGIPIAHDIFEGNTSEKLSLRPVIGRLRMKLDIGRIITVADKGLNTSNNIYYILSGKNGYIFSQTVRGGSKKLKEYVLNEDGYVWKGKEYKCKSRLEPRVLEVSNEDGTTFKYPIDEKQVIFWSKDYADRAKIKREKVLEKAYDLIKNPGKYNKETSYGAAGYVKNLKFSNDGEILKSKLVLDEEKIKEEELYDGYYAIVTSELKMPVDKIIETYRGLWEIEQCFHVIKEVLEGRPVYLSRKDRISAHFLICFIALYLLKIVEKKFNKKYSIEQISESLGKACCSYEEENLWLFDYVDDVLKEANKIFGMDFRKKRMRLGDIKKILADVKR